MFRRHLMLLLMPMLLICRCRFDFVAAFAAMRRFSIFYAC